MNCRHRKRLPFLQSVLGFRIALAVIVVMAIIGGLYYNSIAERFAPTAAHPYDIFANLCFGTVLVALAIILLGSGERVPRKLIRPSRVESVVQARDGHNARPYNGRAKATRANAGIIDAYFPDE